MRDRPGKRAAPAASPSGAAGAGCVTVRGTVRVCGPRGRPPGRQLGIPLPPISPLCPNLLSSAPRGDRGRETESFLPRRLCLAPCLPPPPGLSAAEPVASAPPDWALPGPGGQARPCLALPPPLLPWAPSRTAESRTGWCVTQASTVCPPDPHTWGTREEGPEEEGVASACLGTDSSSLLSSPLPPPPHSSPAEPAGAAAAAATLRGSLTCHQQHRSPPETVPVVSDDTP